MKIISYCIIFFVMSFSYVFACDSVMVAPERRQVDKSKMDKVEKILNGITTFRASFIQYSAAGEASGVFYLSRPGKIRWEYTSPDPIFIVGNNRLVGYYDKALDELTYVHLDDVLAGVLTKKHFDLKNDFKVVDLREIKKDSKYPAHFVVTLEEKGHADKGSISLCLNEKDNSLNAMGILDGNRNYTAISFYDKEIAPKLENSLFKFPKTASQFKRKH